MAGAAEPPCLRQHRRGDRERPAQRRHQSEPSGDLRSCGGMATREERWTCTARTLRTSDSDYGIDPTRRPDYVEPGPYVATPIEGESPQDRLHRQVDSVMAFRRQQRGR